MVLTLLWVVGVEVPAGQRKKAYDGIVVYVPPAKEAPRPLPPIAHLPRVQRPTLPRPAFQAPLAVTRPKTQILEAPVQIPVISQQVTPAPAPVPLPAVPPPAKQVQIGAFTAQVTEKPQPAVHAPAGAAGFDGITASGPAGAVRNVSAGGFDSATSAGQQGFSRSIRAGGFSDATIAKVSTPLRPAQNAGSLFRPVEILQKPKPVYTEEARRLGVQGEVVFEALFTSDGSIRILKTVRSLGHGLDEAALRAAEAIRFRPAERDGQPVDFTAAVHIIFQLAN